MAWTKTSKNGYVILKESLAIADSAGANVVTVNSSDINEDLSNKKFIINVDITESCAGDGGLDADLYGSVDGTTYVQLDDAVVNDLDTTGTNSQSGLADTTTIYAPIYRVTLLTDGTDTQDAAAALVTVAFKE